jgi:hypothetical protein
MIKVIYLGFPHVDDTANAVALLHDFKSWVNVLQSLSVCDELVNLELAFHVVVDQIWKLAAALDTTESTTSPNSASDKLECCDIGQSSCFKL